MCHAFSRFITMNEIDVSVWSSSDLNRKRNRNPFFFLFFFQLICRSENWRSINQEYEDKLQIQLKKNFKVEKPDRFLILSSLLLAGILS